MTRILTWETALIAYAEAAVGHAFEWGRWDCVSLVRGALMAMNGGVDPVPGLAYSNVEEARRALGVHTLWEYLEASGAVPVDEGINFVQNGDVVVSAEDPDHEGVPAMAIWVANRWLMSSLRTGVLLVSGTPDWSVALYRWPLEGLANG